MTELIHDRTELLDLLWQFQNENGHLRDEDVDACSRALNISRIEIEGVISFYHFFHRQPRGQYTIYLNNSIVSRYKGHDRAKEAFERETGGSFGRTDPSGQFGLFETACIGLSDQEPAALINFSPFTNLNSLKVKKIVAKLKHGASPAEICDDVPDMIRSVPPPDKTILMRDYQAGSAIVRLQDRDPDWVIEEIKKSRLAGMGGAFFPAALKWEACRAQSSPTKYIVCNADEGEPGTFKDRVLMNALPGLMLEGMAIAGYAVGAKQGIIYLRAEYTWLRPKLMQVISQFRKMNLLGENIFGIPGFDFDIKLQLGAGAYVCGEETALLNSLEGKRGEPRTKQFYPTEKGYLDQPTVVNNVETFCAAARAIELGADFFLATGTETSPGTKLLSISGDCRRPGIYEVEWGISVRQVLEACQADEPNLIQVSGPSGSCLSMAEIDSTLALDDLQCGGSVMIFNQSRDVLEILRSFTNFFKHEACGLCTPCRAGNFIIERVLDKLALKLGHPSDLEALKSWGKIMKLTSRCGLGKSATNALSLALARFPDYFNRKLDTEQTGLNRGFDLEAATREYDRFSS